MKIDKLLCIKLNKRGLDHRLIFHHPTVLEDFYKD